MKDLLSVFILASGLCLAQIPEGKPASTNVQNARFPLVHPDRRATFQLRAPDAAKSQGVGCRRAASMTRPYRAISPRTLER